MTIQNVIRRGKEWGTRLGSNIAYLYALSEIGERLPNVSSTTEALFAGGAALALLPFNRYIATPLGQGAANFQPQTRAGRVGLAAGLLALVGLPSYGLKDDAQNIIDDVQAIVEKVPIPEVSDSLEAVLQRNKEMDTPTDSRLPDFQKVQLADRESVLGRTQRALRWKPLADAVEKKYGIPQGTLLAMAMQESYGDVLQPNGSNDGGLGLLHMQGTTARTLGLDIYGSSRRDSDRKHGRQLKDMLEGCRYRLDCVAQQDERAHPLKNLDAAARYMLQGVKAHGSWDHGIEWYRGPGLVGKRTGWKYLHQVKGFRSKLNDKDWFRKAERDFNDKNKDLDIRFSDYLGAFHQYSSGFGLDKYR